jgi:hypothetical protein
MCRESRKHENVAMKSHVDQRYGTGQMPCSICHAKEIAINAMKAA